MLWRWLKQADSSQLIGLELCAESIKLVQINNETSPKELIQFAAWPLPKNAVLKGEIKDVNLVAESLRKLIQNFDISGKEVAIAIPKSAVIVKNANVDKRLTTQEIESRAWIEANKNFPDLIGDIYLDYQVVGISPKNENQLELMMVACKKDLVNPYIKAFNQAGLKEKIVDVNCYVLERMIHLIENHTEKSTDTIALLNLNNENSTLVVTQQNDLLYAHDQTFTGNKLKEKAETFIKEKSGANKDGTPLDGNHTPIISMNDAAYAAILQETLVMHLRSTMHFFYSSRSNVKISKILVAGDCATLPDIAPFIQAEVGITTELANPFKHLAINGGIDHDALQKLAPSLVLCAGLAMSDIEKGTGT